MEARQVSGDRDVRGVSTRDDLICEGEAEKERSKDQEENREAEQPPKQLGGHCDCVGTEGGG